MQTRTEQTVTELTGTSVNVKVFCASSQRSTVLVPTSPLPSRCSGRS